MKGWERAAAQYTRSEVIPTANPYHETQNRTQWRFATQHIWKESPYPPAPCQPAAPHLSNPKKKVQMWVWCCRGNSSSDLARGTDALAPSGTQSETVSMGTPGTLPSSKHLQAGTVRSMLRQAEQVRHWGPAAPWHPSISATWVWSCRAEGIRHTSILHSISQKISSLCPGNLIPAMGSFPFTKDTCIFGSTFPMQGPSLILDLLSHYFHLIHLHNRTSHQCAF